MNVDLTRGKRQRNVTQHADTVARGNLQTGGELIDMTGICRHILIPPGTDPTVGFFLDMDIHAVAAMDGHAVAARDKADDQAAQPRPQPVAYRAAEDAAKACRGNEVAEIVDTRGVAAHARHCLLEPALRLGQFRHLGADAPAERVELFDALKVVAMVADTLHNRQRLCILRHETHGDAVRDGERLPLRAIRRDHAAHRLLDAVGLRAGDRKLVADLHRHIGQKIIIHSRLSIRVYFPAEAGLFAQTAYHILRRKSTRFSSAQSFRLAVHGADL